MCLSKRGSCKILLTTHPLCKELCLCRATRQPYSTGPVQGALRVARDGLLDHNSECRDRPGGSSQIVALLLVQTDQEAPRSLSKWWSEAQGEGSLFLTSEQKAYCFRVPREAHFQERTLPLVLLSHQDLLCTHCCVHARLMLTPPPFCLITPMPKPLGPCVILVHLHLYEKGLHLKFLFVFFLPLL